MDLQHINRVAFAIAEKHDIDVDEAIAKMKRTTIWLIANESVKSSRAQQVSYLTTVNIAARVFLGGVKCILPEVTPNLLEFKNETFSGLVEYFGGTITLDTVPDESQTKILFGTECLDENSIEVVASDWRGGLNFYKQERIVLEEKNNKVSLGSIASASMACYSAFVRIFGIFDDNIELNSGISLWNLNAGRDWYKEENSGPTEIYLPRSLWVLGLGHLGQAYLWSAGLMRVENPELMTILLQDFDTVEKENIGSQVLSFPADIGKPKTRSCVRFLEEIGFKTRIVEKPFIAEDLKTEWLKDFPFLLNGVDNAITRRSIDRECLDLFLDGATNGKFSLFDSFTMKNVKYINKSSDALWSSVEEKEEILHANLYQRYEKEHKCGYLTNYGIATPFIGLFGSAIILSEMLRALNKGRRYSIVTLQLRNMESLEAVEEGIYGTEYLRNAM